MYYSYTPRILCIIYTGTVASMAVGITGVYTESQFLLGLADFGYIINLFNLLPIGAMDGGRIANSISPYIGMQYFTLHCLHISGYLSYYSHI